MGLMMKDFWLFRRMLFPAIVQIVFGISVLICVFVGLYGVLHHDVFLGLFLIFVGPVCARIVCEYLVVLFRINNTLTDIKNSLATQRNNML